MNAVLLAAGAVTVVLVAVGGVGFSLCRGPEPGVLRFARVFAAATWIAYGALALLLLVGAVLGSL